MQRREADASHRASPIDVDEEVMIKPKKLKPGDRVAAVSLSWGGPGKYSHRYQAGKQQFESEFGVRVIETRHALRDPEWIAQNPKARADDLMEAFEDDSIQGIISTIGGDDSIRILRYLNLDVIRKNPKVFLGYSDTTISHAACFKAGLVSFYGPSFMSGFGENSGMHSYMAASVRKTLFADEAVGAIAPNTGEWTAERLSWSEPANQLQRRRHKPCTGWRYHQSDGISTGKLFGGCIDVLDWIRGTAFWPEPAELDGSILFLETSADSPSPIGMVSFIRCLAAMGDLERLGGIMLGRTRDQFSSEPTSDYADALTSAVRNEFGLKNIPIVTNMDFGHTDPMFVIPQGLNCRIDSERRVVSIQEPAVTN